MTAETTDTHANAARPGPVGLVGLGHMGMPVASTLARAGFEVVATSRSADARAAIEAQGMVTVASPAALAAEARIILVCVFDTAALEHVVRGDNGLLAGLAPGTVVIDLGTSAVDATIALAAAVESAGGDYIDAPVSGGTRGAAAGELTVFAGAKPEVLEHARPVLEALGRVNPMGGVGSGQSTKAINQLILAQTLVAVAEGLSLAQRLDLDPARVRDALAGGFADSRALREHGRRMVEQDFEPGGSVAVFLKDLRLVRELVERRDIDMPGLATAYERYERAAKDGYAGLDQAAVFKLYD